jgi:hypothetical protein
MDIVNGIEAQKYLEVVVLLGKRNGLGLKKGDY